MTFRRGFKAEAERLSVDNRAELKFRPWDRLDPFALAKHLGIPVLGLREMDDGNGVAPAIRYFQAEGAESFSAVTVYSGRFRIIVHNDRHAPSRQASNVVHELSHTLLEHPPHPDLSPRGCRHVDARIEDEADWLMGALLVPRQGALRLVWEGASVDQVSEHFGVSRQLCQWRMASTGILTQVARGQRD